jgi:hypothetical protein
MGKPSMSLEEMNEVQDVILHGKPADKWETIDLDDPPAELVSSEDEEPTRH